MTNYVSEYLQVPEDILNMFKPLFNKTSRFGHFADFASHHGHSINGQGAADAVSRPSCTVTVQRSSECPGCYIAHIVAWFLWSGDDYME